MEKKLSIVLIIGVVASVIIMCAGLIMQNSNIVMAGIACLIATPILRVVTSVIEFAKEKDWLYVLICIAVLLILSACIIVGINI